MLRDVRWSKQFKITHRLSRYGQQKFFLYVLWLCYSLLNLLQIKLDIAEQESLEFNGYDASNALILPSKKRDSKFKKNPDATNVTRILSKKQRKNLEKIVDKKKKREQVNAADKLLFFLYIRLQ